MRRAVLRFWTRRSGSGKSRGAAAVRGPPWPRRVRAARGAASAVGRCRSNICSVLNYPDRAPSENRARAARRGLAGDLLAVGEEGDEDVRFGNGAINVGPDTSRRTLAARRLPLGSPEPNTAPFICHVASSYDAGSDGMASSRWTPVRLTHPSTTATRLAEGTVAVDEAWISHWRRCRPI